MRPTVAEIDLTAIANNIKAICSKVSPAKVMAVVKADAYGHGAVQVAKVALKNGASSLGVSCVEEGIELRKGGITEPILIFSGVSLNHAEMYLQNDLEATLYTKQDLQNLKKTIQRIGKRATVHINIDTGMGRVGINWSEAVPFIEQLMSEENIEIKGLYSHFATSDHMDKSYAYLQLSRFKNVVSALEEKNIHIPCKHIANSGAVLDIPEADFDMVRPGILIYGYFPSLTTFESIKIEPAMTFKTQVLYIKKLGRGESVSYGRIFISDKDTEIATMPVGYADGYNRLLSNKGEVLINGKKFPVVGRVCMDLIMVDLGLDHDVKIGDDVILFGKQNTEEITVRSICEKCNTIPYEVTCWVSGRVPRIYKN